MTDNNYASRAKEYGFATFEEIKTAYYDKDNSGARATITLDVRSPTEISADGGPVDGAVQTTCTAIGCDELAAEPTKFVPDKDATVIVYCKSGRRAGKAKALLIEKGYTGKILNAGGYDDIVKAIAP